MRLAREGRRVDEAGDGVDADSEGNMLTHLHTDVYLYTHL